MPGEVADDGAPDRGATLPMLGGWVGGLVPLVVLVAVLVWLSVAGGGGTRAFWAAGWLAIVAGLIVARDRRRYCNAVLRGLGDESGLVIVTAWLFAGVYGQLMAAGGLVEGLLWIGLETGAEGAWFTLVAFMATALFALGTGTATGTIVALLPVLYPAGVFLGADPALLAAAALAGGAFGDNLAPVSDTTIVSACTQGATLRDVVRSRLPLALGAAAITVVVLALLGGGGVRAAPADLGARTSPAGLWMLASLAIVVFAALRGRAILEALVWGNVSALLLGMIIGRLEPGDLLRVPDERGASTGLIEDGIGGVVAPIVFALLVLAVTRVLVESGVTDALLRAAERTVARTVRQAELAIVGITILVSVPIAANAPAILLVGPSVVRPLGERFGLTAARRANLMDCAVCTVFYMLPWHIVVIVWHGALSAAAGRWKLPLPSIGAAALNPYAWALLAVLLLSILRTGAARRDPPGTPP